MYWCEVVLIGILASLGFYVIKTDISKGLIPNKYLLIAASAGSVVNAIYYSFWAQDYIEKYVINLIVLCIFSICMYAFHFWSAGDTKLLITLIILYPARFYHRDAISIEIEVIISIFFIAYMYILLDTLRADINKERFYGAKHISKKEVISFFKIYIISYIYLRGFSHLFQWMLGEI